MKNTNIRKLCILALAIPLFQGCIVHRIMDSEDRKNYSEYRMEAERINLEREKANLAPQKIQTLEEWKGEK